MAEQTKGGKKKAHWTRKIARIWSAPIILYGLLMAAGYTWSWLTTGVADPHAVEGTSWTESIPPTLMFLSILGLVIAWRWEGIGGMICAAFQIGTHGALAVLGPSIDDLPRAAIPYLLSAVVTIPGVLFLVYWHRTRRITPTQRSSQTKLL